jgi:hypothetical protein
MLLYVNGDSHSAGHDAGGPDFSFGKHLAKHYRAEYKCDAMAGACNERIIRTTQEYLKENIPDLVVIGWSTWEREEWTWQGETFNITASGTDMVPDPLVEKYKKWVIQSSEPAVQHYKEDKNHYEIWQLHTELKERKIKHLFFNCYSYFHYVNTHNKPKFNWGNNYIDPYAREMTYYFWLEGHGYRPINPRFYHYGPDAHKAWAKFLIPHIDNL